MLSGPRLRQVALVARDCGQVAGELRRAFGWPPPFHDPGVGRFGLTNAVFAVGDTFVEVVAPVQSGTTAAGRYEPQPLARASQLYHRGVPAVGNGDPEHFRPAPCRGGRVVNLDRQPGHAAGGSHLAAVARHQGHLAQARSAEHTPTIGRPDPPRHDRRRALAAGSYLFLWLS